MLPGHPSALDHWQHRHPCPLVIARCIERQCPEVRRGPEKHDGEQQQRHDVQPAGDCSPADHRRECPGSAADNDVLRRPALQPDRVDEHVEQDGDRQHARGEPVGGQTHQHDRRNRQHDPEPEGRASLDAPVRDGPLGRPPHDGVDVAVPPHVDGARGPGCDGDAQHRGQRQHRVQMARRYQQADVAGKHYQRDDPRLEQREPVSCLGWQDRHRKKGSRSSPSLQRYDADLVYHRTRGSSSKVWNGGGEETVHSSVVAPSPQ